MTPRHYSVTPAQLSNFREAVDNAEDTKREGDDTIGTVTHGSGMTKVEIAYSYAAPANTLTLGIKHKPMFITENAVFEHIEQLAALKPAEG